MDLDALLGEDDVRRADAIGACLRRPEHERSILTGRLALVAKEAADALDGGGANDRKAGALLGRASRVLAHLRLEVAKSALQRLVDEGGPATKAAVASALRDTTTAEARAVLVHLLSDDDGRESALVAIGHRPWPDVLPALIEIAEADDRSARLAVPAIAKCAADGGPMERAAAADFLFDMLDDESVVDVAFDTLVRRGAIFPGLPDKAKRLAKEPGVRKIAALCLVAAHGDEGNAGFLELALAGTRIDGAVAKGFLSPLLADGDDAVRLAAERTWKALAL